MLRPAVGLRPPSLALRRRCQSSLSTVFSLYFDPCQLSACFTNSSAFSRTTFKERLRWIDSVLLQLSSQRKQFTRRAHAGLLDADDRKLPKS